MHLADSKPGLLRVDEIRKESIVTHTNNSFKSLETTKDCSNMQLTSKKCIAMSTRDKTEVMQKNN